MQSVKALLEDTAVVKVLHDSRRPSAALLYQQGITLQSVFDTQVKFLLETAQSMYCRLLRVQFEQLPSSTSLCHYVWLFLQ